MLVRVSVLMVVLTAIPTVCAEEEPLPAGLLDFLGMMVEADGELIDPLSLKTAADDKAGGEGIDIRAEARHEPAEALPGEPVSGTREPETNHE